MKQTKGVNSNQKELRTFFYNGVKYIINKEKLSEIQKNFGGLFSLSDTKKLMGVLNKKKISIKDFLEIISICWIKV